MQYRDPRFPSDKQLTVIIRDQVCPAQLINISSTGARLGQIEPLPRNTLLTVSYLLHRFSAQVMWTDGEFTGVRFLVPLSRSELNVLRRDGKRDLRRRSPPGPFSHVFLDSAKL
jgi:hypothetical protein